MTADARRPSTQPMSRVDTAWLRMDNDVNLMLIVSVWLLDRPLDIDAVRARYADKLLQYDRFRQRARLDAMGAHWVEEGPVDLEHHVQLLQLEHHGAQTDREALQALCARLATTPLDPHRPLWQFHVVERYEGGAALIGRIHHCIADGIALVSVVNAITDDGVDPPRRRSSAAGPDDDAEHDWLSDAVIKPIADLTTKALTLGGDGVVKSLEALQNPSASVAGSVELARTGLRVGTDALALALLKDDSPTLLKGALEGRKALAWSEPLPLEHVKAVSRGLGCSINDVLLSCAAGAIGSWLADHGDDPTGKEIRAMVPVNLRPLDKAWQLGNRFGLAPLVLPIGIANPVARVFAVRQRMSELKGSYQPLLAFAVLAMSGMLVKTAQDAVLNLFGKKTTAVMTNVPGPTQAQRFCGATITQSLFWVPSTGNVGLGISILSYNGGVQFGLIVDRALCDEPQAIIDRFATEFDRLLMLTLMMPWAEPAAARSAPKSAKAAAAARGPAGAAKDTKDTKGAKAVKGAKGVKDAQGTTGATSKKRRRVASGEPAPAAPAAQKPARARRAKAAATSPTA